MSRQLRIESLELDLRGIPPEIAEAAAHALGPALAEALAGRHLHTGNHRQLDAGHLASSATAQASDLATGIARQIAQSLTGERP
ncbi:MULTISPECIES: hypothetical protein [unclassified Pseudomonas]|uniref:hypothetical protein n=1 Tax=unclassified Pseudomonas TaxID=196821 RepID=UPI000EA9AA73|nr:MULTISPECIES: hypothetical protein [unclassified Pseudomonas]AYF90642.1 hypothetical protein D6Z43_27190 [Pseudomonas sp. DY-1]MDH4652629.1 hypothetical protein [Pseudomonas sp. BN606]MRK20503.1 hypothetical protein [Pseudomonas sp. JG-B]